MRILVSGLVNIETTVRVRQFPIPYYPIDYPFFGVDSAVSGVAYNIAKACVTLGDTVKLCSMTGTDFPAQYIRQTLQELPVDTANLVSNLRKTPASVVLFDEQGKRQIYCDLKDIQEKNYPFPENMLENVDLVVACNINFNRPLLHLAKQAGKLIATDVHVLSDLEDPYNREFLQMADIVFLSDEAIGEDYHGFLRALACRYPAKIIVLGRGAKGAAMYLRDTDEITVYPAMQIGQVVNTVGAGDALFSSFIHYFCSGKSAEAALARSQIFAAHKIGSSGAAMGFANAEQMEWLCKSFLNSEAQNV